jgi:hypothetical protein
VYAEKPKWVSDVEIACEYSASHYAPQAYDWKLELLKSMSTTNENSRERERIIEIHKRKKEKIFDSNYLHRKSLRSNGVIDDTQETVFSLVENLVFSYAINNLDATEIQIRRNAEFECLRVLKSK